MPIITSDFDKGGRVHIRVKSEPDKDGRNEYHLNQCDPIGVLDTRGMIYTVGLGINHTYSRTTADIVDSDASRTTADIVDSDADCFVGIPALFLIKNFHVTDEYEVYTENGSVYVSDHAIYYTAKRLGRGGFSLNGNFLPVNVVERYPHTPYVSYPLAASEIPKFSLCRCTEFGPLDYYDHVSTQWQVATDSSFSNIVIDVTTPAKAVYYVGDQFPTELPIDQLQKGNYYVRCRHIGKPAELVVY